MVSEVYVNENTKLIKKVTTFSLFSAYHKEVPCVEDAIQIEHLQPGSPLRFYSPNGRNSQVMSVAFAFEVLMTSMWAQWAWLLGYPRILTCYWKFKVDPKKVKKVSVLCDHMDISGDFLNDCNEGDYLSIYHEDEEIGGGSPGRLCGDLNSIIPLNTSFRINYYESSSDVQNVVARFMSHGLSSATGFSCRIVCLFFFSAFRIWLDLKIVSKVLKK